MLSSRRYVDISVLDTGGRRQEGGYLTRTDGTDYPSTVALSTRLKKKNRWTGEYKGMLGGELGKGDDRKGLWEEGERGWLAWEKWLRGGLVGRGGERRAGGKRGTKEGWWEEDA